jgi:hypothetical protein
MEDINSNLTETFATRQKGDSLELAIEYIFNTAGFKTERNVFIAKYEIDVKASIGDRTIIIECKNYQDSSLTIRNIIHQWNSKNEIINAHKIIIALAGLEIKDSDYKLANNFNIELWNQVDLTEFFNLSLKPQELRKKLLEKISLAPLTISERYRDDINFLVTKPLLSGIVIPKEEVYGYFNKWLRAYILTELQMYETTADERSKLIELFEGNKTKKVFFNLVSQKRNEVEYWKAVKEQLTDNSLLSKERQNTYLNYMNSLIKEYLTQSKFFESDDILLKTGKLISSRLYYALHKGESCSFKTISMQNRVKVFFEQEDNIEIIITDISETESNILNWIMTSQCVKIQGETADSFLYKWTCSSLNDAIEKVYRIFTEYYNVSNSDSLFDKRIR